MSPIRQQVVALFVCCLASLLLGGLSPASGSLDFTLCSVTHGCCNTSDASPQCITDDGRVLVVYYDTWCPSGIGIESAALVTGARFEGCLQKAIASSCFQMFLSAKGAAGAIAVNVTSAPRGEYNIWGRGGNLICSTKGEVCNSSTSLASVTILTSEACTTQLEIYWLDTTTNSSIQACLDEDDGGDSYQDLSWIQTSASDTFTACSSGL